MLTQEQVKAAIAEGRELLGSMQTVRRFQLVGSAPIVNNPEDVDFAVLLNQGYDSAIIGARLIDKRGFKACSQYDQMDDSSWFSVRRDNLNLMLTHDVTFYDKFVTAMEVCKALSLVHKTDRVAVCAIVRDGKRAIDVRPGCEESPL